MVWRSNVCKWHNCPVFPPPQPCATINETKYLHLLKDELDIHIVVHGCNVFIHNGATCHTSNYLKFFCKRKCWCPGLARKQFRSKSNKNSFQVMKNEVADQHPTISIESLQTAMTIVWTPKIISEYCCNHVDTL